MGTLMGAGPRRATYADLLAVPDTKVAEILDGELVVSPRPAVPHARAATVLGQALQDFDRPAAKSGEPGGWWLFNEPELHLDEDIVVPDLAGWRRERLPTLGNEAFFTLIPDWACEVLSPSSAGYDRVRKMPIYARAGLVHLWLLDPLARTLEVHRLERSSWVVASTHSGVEPLRAEPFGAVELDPSRWWLDVGGRASA
jgi:Uma2 family endonuclease